MTGWEKPTIKNEKNPAFIPEAGFLINLNKPDYSNRKNNYYLDKTSGIV